MASIKSKKVKKTREISKKVISKNRGDIYAKETYL